MNYRATVDVPERFRTQAVGAVFGLTPSSINGPDFKRTGEIQVWGRDERVMLFEAAQIMLVRLAKSGHGSRRA